MKIRILYIVWVLITCPLLYTPGLAQQTETEADLQAIMKKYEAVGLSVAVVKNNELIYTHAFGLKNKEKQIPLSESDMFRIASISKSFSATSVMQLVEQKKLSLDDDIGKLIGFNVRNPKFPNTVITLKMMLSHTSSLNDSEGYFTLDVINPNKNQDWAKCFNDYEPGKGYQYCNLNFNMVGTVIERVSGERFDAYVKRHVLSPLKLYGGYCVDSLDNSRFATLYAYDGKEGSFVASPDAYAPRREILSNYVMGYSTPVFSPTGGMKISAPDLARYMMMHMNYGRANGTVIMSKKSARLMQTKIAEEEGYAMAMTNRPDLIPGKQMVGHTGSAYGLYSAMFFHPKEKFGIVVITNGCRANYTDGINDLLRDTINSLYNHLIK